MAFNTPLWPLLGLTDGRIGPIRSIGWPCQGLAPICFIPTVLLNLHLQQVPNPYPLGARRGWLRVNSVERIGIWPVLRTWNWQWRGNLPSSRVYWSRIPVSTKANGFPFWFIPNTSWIRRGWWNVGRAKNIQHIWRLQIKNKRNLPESDSENGVADFPRFIVIESLEKVCFAKFSPFLTGKTISIRVTPKNVEKTQNWGRQKIY